MQVHARRHKFDDSVDLRQVAADCPGLVGADLRNLLNEAALEAARRRAPAIQYRDILVRAPGLRECVRKECDLAPTRQKV